MSDTAPYNTSEIDEAVTRLMETREKFLYTLYEQRIAEAVAAERERCEAIAEKWRKTWDDLAHEFQGKDVSMARNAASLANAAWQIKSDIRARAGEGGDGA
ncbi:MAG TPA: hypothetical protein VM537_01100 [Anaerolineae bacterium]|nr:hypothetical protein [Anaerolineae bacterium]